MCRRIAFEVKYRRVRREHVGGVYFDDVQNGEHGVKTDRGVGASSKLSLLI